MDDVGRIELRRKNGTSMWAVVDLVDLSRIEQYRWRAHILPHAIYARGRVLQGGRVVDISMHRFIMEAPAGMDVDHVDHDGLNNRRSNLRMATRSQNIANMLPERGASSAYKGVCWDAARGRWKAQIRHGVARRQIGRFNSEIEAALAYDAAARETFGEFALVNFPNGLPDLVA